MWPWSLSDMSLLSVQVLRNFDSLISSNCTKELQNSGIDLWKNSQVRSVSKTDKGLEVTIATRDPERKNEEEKFRTIQEVDCLLWAIGRQPNISGLNIGHLVRVSLSFAFFGNRCHQSIWFCCLCWTSFSFTQDFCVFSECRYRWKRPHHCGWVPEHQPSRNLCCWGCLWQSSSHTRYKVTLR